MSKLNNQDLKSIIELDLIRDDMFFYAETTNYLMSQNSSGVLFLEWMPYLSLFVVETYKYFSKRVSTFSQAVSIQNINSIRLSRTMVKLFDEDLRTIVEIENAIQRMTEYHRQWFEEEHKGALAWLKKIIQPDLGIYYYNNRIICTTHVASFNLGFIQSNNIIVDTNKTPSITQSSFAIGHDLGSYIALLFHFFGHEAPELENAKNKPNNNDIRIEYSDVKASRYYGLVFNGSSSPLFNFCALTTLAATNFIRHIVDKHNSPITPSVFKLKFITLYHLYFGLKKLQDYYYPQGVFSETSKTLLRAIYDDKELKKILQNKKFRNILVHYSLGNIPKDLLSLDKPLYGLVETFFDGMSFSELHELIDNQTDRILSILELWLYTKQKSSLTTKKRAFEN